MTFVDRYEFPRSEWTYIPDNDDPHFLRWLNSFAPYRDPNAFFKNMDTKSFTRESIERSFQNCDREIIDLEDKLAAVTLERDRLYALRAEEVNVQNGNSIDVVVNRKAYALWVTNTTRLLQGLPVEGLNNDVVFQRRINEQLQSKVVALTVERDTLKSEISRLVSRPAYPTSPGTGYRWVVAGDVLQKTDEYFSHDHSLGNGRWKTIICGIGVALSAGCNETYFRRKVAGAPLRLFPTVCGEGWRFLREGELLAEGDQVFLDPGIWHDTCACFGTAIRSADSDVLQAGCYRRKVEPTFSRPATAGDGYIFVPIGDRLRVGDEGWTPAGWSAFPFASLGAPVGPAGSVWFPFGWSRRKVEPSYRPLVFGEIILSTDEYDSSAGNGPWKPAHSVGRPLHSCHVAHRRRL